MLPVLEAVPNFSSGRDRALLERLVWVATEWGAEVLDASSDPDHDRSVLTLVGPPAAVEDASVALAKVAVEAIDLKAHRGVHPRIGALDVLPFVPLSGLTMEEARISARRVGERLVREIGVPVYFYAQASDPPGRGLAELRRGGFEALVAEFPKGRTPDLLPEGWNRPGVHPTAGAVCVGARPLLLAWNVGVVGLEKEELEGVARGLRESQGGISGLRALALMLESQSRMQISMNLEDVSGRRAFEVFTTVEARVAERGGRVTETEVIGLIPDQLLWDAGSDRLSLRESLPERSLSHGLARHVSGRAAREAERLAATLEVAADEVPPAVREAAARLIHALSGGHVIGEVR
ncbi:MAG: glutamate formimidoyltransferase [Gemmatimonadota bacterium]